MGAYPRGERVRAITPQQIRFVSHYIDNGHNGTQAAIAAGYSEKSAASMASQLLRKPQVIEELRSRLEDEERAAGISRTNVLRNLRDIMEARPRYALDPASGEVMRDSNGEPCMVSEPITTNDRIAAAKQICRMLGYDAPLKLEHVGEMGVSLHVITQLKRDVLGIAAGDEDDPGDELIIEAG